MYNYEKVLSALLPSKTKVRFNQTGKDTSFEEPDINY